MKVLILSANTGQGHNSCSEALKEKFTQRGHSCEISDSLAFMSKKISGFVTRLHVGVYRKAPGAFKWGYSVSEDHPGIYGKRSPIYLFFKKGASRIKKYIEEGGYNIVIACHVFAAEILTAAKEMGMKPVKSAFVATDYTRSPGVDQSDLDLYFIPDESLSDEFIIKNITREKLRPCGLPVRERFYSSCGRICAKERLGVGKDSRHLIVIFGSMGCGPMERLSQEIAKRLAPGQEVSIVCGTNEKLEKRLSARFRENDRVHIYGYFHDISLLMDSADLCLTKPGGISTTEAAAKRLPMVFANTVSGCEEYNCRFFSERGGAVTAKGVKQLSALCVKLLSDEKLLKEMSEALERSIPENAAENICSALLSAAD